MSKQFWAVIAVIVLIFVGLFALSGGKSNTSPQSKSSSKTLSQHVTGKGTTGVKLVEYGDFQCPACEAYEPVVEQVRAQYGDKIQFQFRNFPLTSLHQNAFAAARAAEAAAIQNKFWEMHDLLYNQGNWQQWTNASSPETFFNQYATQLGLNVDKFKQDYKSTAVNDLINADMAEGNRLGITGTPTFFVNGRKIDNIRADLAAFTKLLDGEIAKKSGQQ